MKLLSLLSILIISCGIALSGCASKPTPQEIWGEYYLTNDSDCVMKTGPMEEGGPIKCYTEDGKFTGQRYPMTSQDKQEYRKKQTDERATQRALVQFTKDMSELNQQITRDREAQQQKEIHCYADSLGGIDCYY